MGRKHTFYDSTFNRDEFDPDDDGDFEPNLVFLIMPFKGAGMDDVYSAIKDECRKLGLHTRRADEFSGSGMIIDEITALIEKAEFIICDLTFERPNVYYELGYAHGVGNEALDILLIAHEGLSVNLGDAGIVELQRSIKNVLLEGTKLFKAFCR